MAMVADSPASIHPAPKPEPRLRVLAMRDGTWTVEVERASRFGARVVLMSPGQFGCSCAVDSRLVRHCEHIAAVREFERDRREWGPEFAPMAQRNGSGIGFSGPRWSETDEFDGRVDPAELFGARRFCPDGAR